MPIRSDVESISRAELEKIQLERLQRTTIRLSPVDFYKKSFRACRVAAEKIASLSDLKYLPFTTKKDLRDEYPHGFLACEPRHLARFHASSGTRGKPTLAAYTKEDLETWSELCARSLVCAGARSGDVIHNAYGYGLFTGGMGMHYGIEKLGAVSVPASGGRTAQQLTLLVDLGPRVLCATPSYALNLACALDEAGIEPSKLKLKVGVLGAEPWTEPMRQQIQTRLGIRAFDIYGASELIGPGVACECEEQAGLHIWEDHFLPEIVDPKTGEALPDGEEGELVVTTLSKQAMPYLRFRTGDLAALNREPCRCGRTMARMTRVRARLDDMLIIRGVNVYPSEIENILLSVAELAPHYQLVLKREKALDELVVQVELNSGSDCDQSALCTRLTGLLKEHLGLTAQLEVLPARSIARSEGKACRVVDLRAV